MDSSLPVFPNGCSVIVIRNYSGPLHNAEILIGKRHDGQGWGFPGGGIETHETPLTAASRELFEEFGLSAMNMEFLGHSASVADARGTTSVVVDYCFLCDTFEGDIIIQEGEIDEYKWVRIPELYQMHDLFKPAWDDLLLLNKKHTSSYPGRKF